MKGTSEKSLRWQVEKWLTPVFALPVHVMEFGRGANLRSGRKREPVNSRVKDFWFPYHSVLPLDEPYWRSNAIIAPKPTNTPPVTRLNAFATRRLLSVAPMRVPKPA